MTLIIYYAIPVSFMLRQRDIGSKSDVPFVFRTPLYYFVFPISYKNIPRDYYKYCFDFVFLEKFYCYSCFAKGCGEFTEYIVCIEVKNLFEYNISVHSLVVSVLGSYIVHLKATTTCAFADKHFTHLSSCVVSERLFFVDVVLVKSE